MSALDSLNVPRLSLTFQALALRPRQTVVALARLTKMAPTDVYRDLESLARIGYVAITIDALNPAIRHVRLTFDGLRAALTWCDFQGPRTRVPVSLR